MLLLTLMLPVCWAQEQPPAQKPQRQASQASVSGETLQELLSDLQNSPDDRAVREKIIKLVLGMKKKPALPKEALQHEGAAEYAFKNAKDRLDYAAAAKEYERSLLAAPWRAENYLSLGAVQEKAGQFQKAVSSLELYLIAAPDARDADEVQKRIGGLQFAAGKASAKEEERTRQAEEQRLQQESAAQAQTLQQESAAQEQRLQGAIQSMMEDLRGKVEGYSYTPYYCGTKVIDKGFNPMQGCNLQEYSGNNWYRDAGSATYKFYFPGDGTVRIVQSSSYPKLVYLIGTPKGPAFSDISWECSNDPMLRAPRSPAWVKLYSNGADIYYSCDRPRSDAYFNPQSSHEYHWYTRR